MSKVYAVMEYGHEHGELLGVYEDRALADQVAASCPYSFPKWEVEEVALNQVPQKAAQAAMQEIERLKALVDGAA